MILLSVIVPLPGKLSHTASGMHWTMMVKGILDTAVPNGGQHSSSCAVQPYQSASKFQVLRQPRTAKGELLALLTCHFET
jgi:hypothetical protein